MLRLGRTGRLVYAMVASLYAVAFLAGGIHSLRVERRLPEIDLIVSGPQDLIDTLVERRDYVGAINQLQMQTRLQPYNSAAREQLGSLLATQGRPAEARGEFQALVRLRSDYPEGYYYLGSAYLDSGQPALAARNFERAIQLKPEYPLAYNSLGVARVQLGELAQAEKCFAKAVELSLNYEEARTNLERARKDLRRRP